MNTVISSVIRIPTEKFQSHNMRNYFTQIDRFTPKSHPGDPENALFCGQEKFSGECALVLSHIIIKIIQLAVFDVYKPVKDQLSYPSGGFTHTLCLIFNTQHV